MSTTTRSSTTLYGRDLNLVPYSPSPSTTPPSSTSYFSSPARVDALYRIVRIKPTNRDWLMPSPSDFVQITGPVSRGSIAISDAEEVVVEGEEDHFRIPCVAHLSWGDWSVSLECLYQSPAAIFTDAGECADETANVADKVDRANGVSITMQEAIFRQGKMEDETVEEEDMRDDNGNPFMVLHVKNWLGRSARLYCKKVSHSQIGLTDDLSESLELEKSDEEVGGQIDAMVQRDKMIGRDKETRIRCVS